MTFFQCVLRVGVVHKDGRLSRDTDLFETARNRAEIQEPCLDGPVFNSQGMGRRCGGKDVIKVISPDKGGLHRESVSRSADPGFDSLEGERESRRPDVARALQPEGKSLRRGHLVQDAPAVGVVSVDDHGLFPPPDLPAENLAEKSSLRLEIGFQRLVIIEVILREIRENPRVELTVIHSFLVQGVRGYLHDHMADPRVQHLPEHSLEVEGFRCRVGRLTHLRTVTVIDRPDDTG